MVKRISSIIILLLTLQAAIIAQAPATCQVTGTVYAANGSVKSGAVLTITPLGVSGTLLHSASFTATSNASGVVTFSVIRNAQYNLKGNLLSYGGSGLTVTIPNASSATLESLTSTSLVPASGLTVKDEGTSLASLIGTFNFVGSGVSVAQSSAGVATVTITSGGGGGGGGGDSVWGSITGTLSDQTDLQAALDAKAASSHTHSIANVTGLQTALDAKLTQSAADLLYAVIGHNHSGVYEPANANIQNHIANTSNPHNVTKSQIGLGSVSNALQLVAANNLSDLTDASAARSNLGLGSLATQSGTFSGTSSGTNTGDQTSVTGNAGTATALATPRTINGTSFDGSANITVTAAAGTLTGTTLNSSVVTSSLTTVGTIATGVWNGTDVALANIAPSSAASKLLGRGDSGAGDFQEITIGSGLTMTGTTLSASGGSGANTALSNLASVAISQPLTTGAGVAAVLTATAPAAITTAQAGIAATLTASPAVAGSSVAGAAAGGSVTITAGAAARLTSGNANGGDINLNTGAGIGTGTAGAVRVNANAGLIIAQSANANSLLQFTYNGGTSAGYVAGWTSGGIAFINTSGTGYNLVSTASQLTVASPVVLGWSASTNASLGADTGLGRNGTATIEANNGTAGRWGQLKVGTYDASVSAITNGLTVGHQKSSGTPAAGMGSGTLYRIDSSTTADQDAAQVAAVWTVATHASRTAEFQINVVNNAAALANSAKFDLSSTANDTGFWLYDANSGTVKRVVVGASDSGGTGFRLLRITN